MKKIALLALVFFGGALLVWCGTKTSTYTTEQVDNFAVCLTQKWVKMYGTDWCSHCLNTKKMFGESFSKITFINCDPKNTQSPADINIQCRTAWIEWYPTRIYKWAKYPWALSLEELSEISGCSLSWDTIQPTTDATTIISTWAEILIPTN